MPAAFATKFSVFITVALLSPCALAEQSQAVSGVRPSAISVGEPGPSSASACVCEPLAFRRPRSANARTTPPMKIGAVVDSGR